MEEVRYLGSVIWFDNKLSYGFIQWEKDGQPQKDLFVHFSDINCEGFKTVKKGQRVSFAIGKNNKGVDKAIDVVVEAGK